MKVCHFNSLSESDIFMDDKLVPGRLSFSGRGRGRRGGYRLLEGVEGEVGAAAGGANLWEGRGGAGVGGVGAGAGRRQTWDKLVFKH